jgi:uncharacterized protein YwgA
LGDFQALGRILKRIDNYDKMESFNGRLKLQKTIYVMQSFDLYIGYNFSWYVRGPYCTELATDGYKLRNIYDSLQHGKFTEPEAEERFVTFLNFLNDHRNDADWLEIVASIHFLKTRNKDLPREEIVNIVKDKQWYFTRAQCEEGWNHLDSWRKI